MNWCGIYSESVHKTKIYPKKFEVLQHIFQRFDINKEVIIIIYFCELERCANKFHNLIDILLSIHMIFADGVNFINNHFIKSHNILLSAPLLQSK